jgi:hypothetical protein
MRCLEYPGEKFPSLHPQFYLLILIIETLHCVSNAMLDRYTVGTNTQHTFPKKQIEKSIHKGEEEWKRNPIMYKYQNGGDTQNGRN